MAQAYKNKSQGLLICEECGTDIEPDDIFWKEDSQLICECCYEDRHEYDNE